MGRVQHVLAIVLAVLTCTAMSLPQPPGNPVADVRAQIVVNSQVRFTVLTNSLVRMEYQPATNAKAVSSFEDRQTLVVWNRLLPVPSVVASQSGNITTIATSSFVLKYTAGVESGFTPKNLEVALKSPRLWMNTTKWHPGDKPHGNLKGTFHTLDGLEGWQSMNCTADNAAWNNVGFGSQPLAHCAWGLISKDGWSLVDDSRSPLFVNGWPTSQLGGMCDVFAPLSTRTPCFQDPDYNPDNDSVACEAAGCCFDSAGTAPLLPLNLFFSSSRNDSYSDVSCNGCSTLYNFIDFQGWLYQDYEEGMVELQLYWNPRPPGGDNALVVSAPSLPGYTFVRAVGYIYAPTAGLPPVNHSAVKLWYSTSMQDYFTTATMADQTRAQQMGYTFVSLLGYLLTADVNSSTPVPIPIWTPMCFQRSGNVDWYLFTHGLNYSGALQDFALVSGAVPVPRRHWLGVSWSRWGNEWTEADTYEQVQNLTSFNFPLSTYVFDMNWHLKPDWTGWTWDTQEYPDPPSLLQWLHGKNLPIGANLHDAQGVMPFELRYPEMAQANGIDPKSNETVAFRISNQTYADTLSELVLQPLALEGFDFWWTDWQQGEVLGVPDCTGLNPTFMLNHYRFFNYSGSDTRGLIHSRWGGLGNHRYASGFGGDVIQSWQSLQFMVYFTTTAANVLFGYWGHEMMALQDAPLTAAMLELFTRVMQFGAYSPVYTNWGNNGSDDDLWSFPAIYRDAVQQALAYRVQLLPYRYTLSRVAHDTAVSTMRPMYYAYPTMPGAYDADLQYMLGDSLLVAPVTSAMDNITEVANVTIWCPPLHKSSDWWVSLDDPSELLPADNEVHVIEYPLNRTPVFVRDGALIPALSYTDAITLGSASIKSYTNLELWIYPSSSSSSSSSAWLYEDDGISSDYLSGASYANTSFTYQRNSSGCSVLTIQTVGTYATLATQRSYTVRILASTTSTSKLTIQANGEALSSMSSQCSATTAPAVGTWCSYKASPYNHSSLLSVAASLPVYATTQVVSFTLSCASETVNTPTRKSGVNSP